MPLWFYFPQRNWEIPSIKGFCIFNHPLPVQGIYDTPLHKGYKPILCAQRCEMILSGFGIHV